MTLVITVPGKPMAKGRPRFVRATGRTFTPPATAAAEQVLKWTAMQEMGDRPLYDGPLRLTFTAQFEPPASWSGKKKAAALAGAIKPTGRPDIDNLLKLKDGLNGVVWHDDAQIVEVVATKRYGAAACTTMTVEAASVATAEEAAA